MKVAIFLLNKFLKSRTFVIICTIFTFALGMAAGTLLAYQPYVTGTTSGWVSPISGGNVKGSTNTEYIFQLNAALGYWLFAIILAFIVFWVCLLIRYTFIHKQHSHAEKSLDEDNHK